MLMNAVTTATVTTVNLVPTAANAAHTALTGVDTLLTTTNRALNVLDANAASWERRSLTDIKYRESNESETALRAAALNLANADMQLNQTLGRNGPTLNDLYDQHYQRLSKI